MKTNILQILGFALAIPCCQAGVAQAFVQPQPSPVLVSSTTEAASQPAAVEKSSITETFTAAYQRKNAPRIAVFWNRQFTDQLSQWQQNRRRKASSAHAAEYVIGRDTRNPVDFPVRHALNTVASVPWPGEAPEYDATPGLRLRGVSRTQTSEYNEFRVQPDPSEGMGAGADFEFAAGFTSTLVPIGVRLVDRSAIMRLIDRDRRQNYAPGDNSDYQEVETSALISYADYLAEIRYSPRMGKTGEAGFMVAVKEVKSGRLMAMFSMEATVTQQAGQEKWIATNEGYRRVTEDAPEPSLYEMGEELASETMQALARAWTR